MHPGLLGHIPFLETAAIVCVCVLFACFAECLVQMQPGRSGQICLWAFLLPAKAVPATKATIRMLNITCFIWKIFCLKNFVDSETLCKLRGMPTIWNVIWKNIRFVYSIKRLTIANCSERYLQRNANQSSNATSASLKRIAKTTRTAIVWVFRRPLLFVRAATAWALFLFLQRARRHNARCDDQERNTEYQCKCN